MLIRSDTINSLPKLHVVFCIVHGSFNLDFVSLVIRVIGFADIYCVHIYSVTVISMIAGFVPFGLPFANSNTSHVNMTSLYTSIGLCNKIVSDFDFDFVGLVLKLSCECLTNYGFSLQTQGAFLRGSRN